MDSIEFELWELLQHPEKQIKKGGFWWTQVDPEELLDLAFLTKETDSWAIWQEEAIPIPLNKWEKEYETWKTQNIKNN